MSRSNIEHPLQLLVPAGRRGGERPAHLAENIAAGAIRLPAHSVEALNRLAA